jgi:glycosyltransferase involved in cell wall biosynthesis
VHRAQLSLLSRGGLPGLKPKIALVVQRYGIDIAGGSEQLCRMIAERLSVSCSCDVITTCARDYVTWKNEFPPGETSVNGVRVHRFSVDTLRDTEYFNTLSSEVFSARANYDLEHRWMKAQGPYSTPMFAFLKNNRSNYDTFIFFTYLYCTTFFGLPLVSDRSILVPTAHDEPPIYLSIFDELFRLPQRFLFLTAEEQDFVYRRFCLPETVGEIAGLGLDSFHGEVALTDLPENVRGVVDAAPYMLYLGRIDESKGCKTLMDWFGRYTSEHPDSNLHLVLAGKAVIPIPSHPRIIAAGYVSEAAKQALIKRAIFMIAPSPYESLCISALEAWLQERPVLANGDCLVLAGQCRRSDGGLWYRNYDEFAECLSLLTADEQLRTQLGKRGRQFVAQEYTWDRVEKIYLRNIALIEAPVGVSARSMTISG